MSFQVLKISLIGHRKRILASLGDRLHEDPPQKPPRSITLRVSAQHVHVGLYSYPWIYSGQYNEMTEAVGQEVQAVLHIAYLIRGREQSHVWLCFIKQDFFFPPLVKYIFLRFRYTSDKPPPLKSHSRYCHPTLPSTPGERKWVFCETPQTHRKKTDQGLQLSKDQFKINLGVFCFLRN